MRCALRCLLSLSGRTAFSEVSRDARHIYLMPPSFCFPSKMCIFFSCQIAEMLRVFLNSSFPGDVRVKEVQNPSSEMSLLVMVPFNEGPSRSTALER